MAIEFLATEDVLYIHQNQIERYGGEHGVRDQHLLESAVAQPQATFDGQYLHSDLFEMAAAYLFHIVQNHPFADGNKRTGAVAALVFFDWNHATIRTDEGGLVEITLRVATGQVGKTEIADHFRSLAE